MLSNTNNSKVKYLKVTNGAIRERVEENTPNAKAREYTVVGTGEKKTAYELNYNLLTGKIKNVYFKEQEFNNTIKRTFNLVVVDDGVDFILQFDEGSKLASTIFKMMPNIDVNKEVEISVNESKNQKGKMQTSLFINQQGINVKWKFKMGEMGDCPDLEKVMFKGEEQWDNTKQLKFFKDIIIPEFENRLKERGEVEVDINYVKDPLDEKFEESISGIDLEEMDSENIPF